MKLSGMTQNVFLKSLKQAKEKGQIGTSQQQASIKLLEKKSREKGYIKNWRPISLLNVDTEVISNALTAKLKNSSDNNFFNLNSRC